MNLHVISNDTDKYLSLVIAGALKFGASDIHVRSNSPAMLRIDGVMKAMKGAPVLSKQQLQKVIDGLLSDTHKKELAENKQVDVAYGDKTGTRVRMNIFYAMGDPALVLRVIHNEIPTLRKLGLPAQVSTIADIKQGLVIFTGSTGSGKSTSMASILNKINQTRREHILMIEDPVEYLFKEEKSVISQRQVGIDVPNFALAMRAALREDPDIILMGEMRDPESIEIALNAAETGHLVFSTLHAPTSADAVTRLVASFEGEAQQTIRAKLAQNLKTVVSQRLLPKVGGGRVAACEVMSVNARIRELILDPLKIKDISDIVKSGDKIEGMLDFDTHLVKLVKEGLVERDVALFNATSATDLTLKLDGF